MRSSTDLLYGAIVLLMFDSILELAFVSDMVAWLAGLPDAFLLDLTSVDVWFHSTPQHLLLDQGHTSIGAAGTAFVIVGLGGILALTLRRHQVHREGRMHGFVRFLYNFWLAFTVISAALTLAAFIFVMVVTYTHANQTISSNVALHLGIADHTRAVMNPAPYPYQQWTPQGWFTAVSQFPEAFTGQFSGLGLSTHLAVMEAWEWNLIPMWILGVVVAVLAFWDRTIYRRLVEGRIGEEEQGGRELK